MPFVSNLGAEIYYESHGEGPAVVFAHGRGGNAASWWQQVPGFSRDHRVIVFDHRAFGRSRCEPGAFERSRFASDLVTILDVEGIARTAIVCQSMGGWTGLRTAVDHPERVKALVLSNTPAGIDTPEVSEAMTRTRARFAEQGVGRAAVAENFPARAPELAFLYAQISGLNVNLPENLYGSADALAPSRLADMRVPTLFITSDEDALFPAELIRGLSRLVPGARCVELEGAGHSPYFERADAFNQVVREFLAEHRG